MRLLSLPLKLVAQARHALSSYSYLPVTENGVPSPDTPPRRRRVELAFLVVFAIAIPATVLWDLRHSTTIDLVNLPDLVSIQHYEGSLPQHTMSASVGGRYVRFVSQHHWGAGFNNLWEEVILLNEIALRADRAYTFRTYVLSDMSEWPSNVFMSGPSAGGPYPPEWNARPSISAEWWNVICPPARRRQISSDRAWEELALGDKFDGEEVVAKWAKYLRDMPEACVEIDGRGFFDLDFWFGSARSVAIWPTLSKSPILTHHAWSKPVYRAVSNNLPILTGNKTTHDTEKFVLPEDDGQLSLPPLKIYKPLHNLAALHIRRGDYEGHCWILRHFDAPYAAWNVIPGLPDTYKPDNSSEDTKSRILEHCLPSPQQVAGRVERAMKDYLAQNPRAERIDHFYVMTNANEDYLTELRTAMGALDFHNVLTWRDLTFVGSEKFAGQIVDMEIGIRAALFIGNGFSTLTSTVVALRLVRGAPMNSSRFW
ncbi:hypothetical protein EXIGLDRAFT_734488 [Exidia glandulosa HHB12029]|uniref:Uncharacterized protein n=1 Tax=Exidia glandulosa HHB12029 TaxID=1314781 RepID=A0A165PLJ5_EXIGL|nr:hypothetical protein EXIGLDRAFT_734488 [Exidia glandulosa HHB12029]